MKPCDYNNILTGLIMTLSGLKERRSSAGRRLLLQSIVADIEELCTLLKNEVHERVSREIWLEADEGIDYASLADQLQRLQPVELVKAVADEEEAVGGLNRAVEALSDLLFSIADALDRHHSNEDYLKLFDDQMKLFVRLRYKNAAKQSYTRWCEKDCLGSPTIEDLEEYRSVRLMKLFRTGIYKERDRRWLAASITITRWYSRYPTTIRCCRRRISISTTTVCVRCATMRIIS